MPKSSPHPPPNVPQIPLSQELRRLARVCDDDQVMFSFLVRELRYRGHALVTLFLSFPFLLPIPLPGVSVVFGIFVIICGIRISFQWRPWIPRRWRKKMISGVVLRKAFGAGEKVVRLLEKFIRPRGVAFATHSETIRAAGLLLAFCGLLLSLPLPPGTNSPPALAILLLSIGLLEKDSLFLVLGTIAVGFNLCFFSAIIFFGFEGGARLLHWLY